MTRSPIHSLADTGPDGRMYAPSAARNVGPICDIVAQHAPETGAVLEIASGTGEHVAALAIRLPGLTWQPSDPAPDRRVSIDGHAKGVPNILPAIDLDAASPGWSATLPGQNLILTVNLLHLIPETAARTLIAEAAMALAPDGRFLVYGPFLRDGETTSDGDARFHAAIQADNPANGYKDDWDVVEWLHQNWLELVQVVEMPANNLCFVARKPG